MSWNLRLSLTSYDEYGLACARWLTLQELAELNGLMDKAQEAPTQEEMEKTVTTALMILQDGRPHTSPQGMEIIHQN